VLAAGPRTLALRTLLLQTIPTFCFFASCGGKAATNEPQATVGPSATFVADTVLTTGHHLAVLGIGEGALYAVDWWADSPDSSTNVTVVRGLRIPRSGQGDINELGTEKMTFFHSAAVWRSGILVLGAAADADPKYYVLGGGAVPDVQSQGAIGMLSNLAVANDTAYFADPETGSVMLYGAGFDGSTSSMPLPPMGKYAPAVSAEGSEVCVASETTLRCSSSSFASLVRGAGTTSGGNFTPIVVHDDYVFEFDQSRLIRVSTTPTADPQLVTTFSQAPEFDPFYEVNLPGRTLLTADGPWIYFAAQRQGLLRVPVSGGGFQAVVPGETVNSVAIDGDAIFFTTVGDDGTSTLHGMPKP
jgi:hypothetical protein